MRLYIRAILKYNGHGMREVEAMQYPMSRRRDLGTYAAVFGAMIAIFAAMHIITGTKTLAYPYPSYLLQAQAWLRGEISIPNYEYLELAVFDGRCYVSFPPVPSVPMALYALIFGNSVPAGLFQKIYIMIAAALILSELLRTGRLGRWECAAWSVLFCLGSAMLPISLVGAVWYEAQILAFLFSVSAIIAVRRGHITTACVCYALAIGCRPFSALLGPVLAVIYLRGAGSLRDKLLRAVPGLLFGIAIACAYAAYNYMRFGDPLEFGHNYLPEFTRADHGQLSFAYLWPNLKTFLFGSPVSIGADGTVSLNLFAFSMFLSCPMILVSLIWFISDIFRRRADSLDVLIFSMQAANVILLCMHRTLGGYQFGARYALELMPLCLLRLLRREKPGRWALILLAVGLIFNFIGGCMVHV